MTNIYLNLSTYVNSQKEKGNFIHYFTVLFQQLSENVVSEASFQHISI